MLGIVKNNKIIPLTTDAGAGAPIGTLIQQYKKVPMSGYLYCDGSTFDENAYPALYMYLGSNVLPDYRECVMVGAEQNTTDTIATHDVYGEGEFKDDQLQNITGKIEFGSAGVNTWGAVVDLDGAFRADNGVERGVTNIGNISNTASNIGFDASLVARTGDTTHGKQKAVYVYIKATSGLAENQQDNVLNATKDYVDNSNSYSTQEVKTGGTWIDGKPIYRKVLTATLQTDEEVLNLTISPQMKSLVSIQGILSKGNTDFVIPYCFIDGSSTFQIYTYCQGQNLFIRPRSSDGTYFTAGCTIRAILEYTKTTD